MVFPPVFGWFASPLSVLVSLAVVAVSAYFAVPLLLKETAEHKAADVALSRPLPSPGSQRPDGIVQQCDDRYRAVVETMNVAALIIEEDGTISLVNSEFEKLSGFSRREIEGKKHGAEFVAPDSQEKLHIYREARRRIRTAFPELTEHSSWIEVARQGTCYSALTLCLARKKASYA